MDENWERWHLHTDPSATEWLSLKAHVKYVMAQDMRVRIEDYRLEPASPPAMGRDVALGGNSPYSDVANSGKRVDA